jgi:hypothetical protein
MPCLRLTVGAREQMEPAIVEASSLGLLGVPLRIGLLQPRGAVASLLDCLVGTGNNGPARARQ